MKFIKALKVRRYLSDYTKKTKIVYMEECGSTNEEAKRRSDYPNGTLFIADRQTAGKGRLGRKWESRKGDGVYMSILLKPEAVFDDVSQVTLIAGIAAARALGDTVKIKWPNDIIIGTKKVSGILTELSSGAVICGIGINVNTPSFPDGLRDKATSLFIETKKKNSVLKVAAMVLNEFMPLYEEFLKSGFAPLQEEYKSRCINIGKEVLIIKDNTQKRAYAEDIAPDGSLIVSVDGEKLHIKTGEVSIRGVLGYV